jgi:hypothetical protein
MWLGRKCVEQTLVMSVLVVETLVLFVPDHQLLPDGLGNSAHEQVTSTSK